MDKKPYKYDFNVIYNRTHGKTDTVPAFVDYIAEDFLEGDHMLKGYFADRDMLPGRNLFDENIRVIEQSKFTIIVLDIGFINNSWSMYLNQVITFGIWMTYLCILSFRIKFDFTYNKTLLTRGARFLRLT